MSDDQQGREVIPRLRERKKLKTKRLIQNRALALFAAKGYDATTMEEIAEAAEVSASTVFRYYPTKAHLVITDIYDDMVADVFRAQSADLDLLTTLEQTVTQLIEMQSDDDLASAVLRNRIAFQQPALWSALLPFMKEMSQLLIQLLNERRGSDTDEQQIRTLVAAVVGILIDIVLRYGDTEGVGGRDRMVADVHAAFAQLRRGFSL